MGIVGDRPESGLRLDVTRSPEGGPPWRYRGEAVSPDARFAIEATIGGSGEVAVDAPGAPAGFADRARLLLRAVWKHAEGERLPPPRRIVRWRPDGEAVR
jgi:hypothetical protein